MISFVVTSNEIVGLFCRDYPLERPFAIFVWFRFLELRGSSLAKAVYMELRSSYHSAKKILALGTSTNLCM